MVFVLSLTVCWTSFALHFTCTLMSVESQPRCGLWLLALRRPRQELLKFKVVEGHRARLYLKRQMAGDMAQSYSKAGFYPQHRVLVTWYNLESSGKGALMRLFTYLIWLCAFKLLLPWLPRNAGMWPRVVRQINPSPFKLFCQSYLSQHLEAKRRQQVPGHASWSVNAVRSRSHSLSCRLLITPERPN